MVFFFIFVSDRKRCGSNELRHDWTSVHVLSRSGLNIVGTFLMCINNEYVHNHVFRASVNDKDGDIVILNKEEGSTYSVTYPIDDAWKPENLSVVSFVFNSDGVQQVEKTPLIAK